MEERWIFEAVAGTYLPLLQMFEGLVADAVRFRCTVSLSPPLKWRSARTWASRSAIRAN